MTPEEINAVAELASEKTANKILAALGLIGEKPSAFLHSLTAEEFATCVERCPEYVRRLLRARSSKIPPEYITARRPYKLKGSLLSRWHVTPDVALARLAAAKKKLEQSHAPSALPSAA